MSLETTTENSPEGTVQTWRGVAVGSRARLELGRVPISSAEWQLQRIEVKTTVQ